MILAQIYVVVMISRMQIYETSNAAKVFKSSNYSSIRAAVNNKTQQMTVVRR